MSTEVVQYDGYSHRKRCAVLSCVQVAMLPMRWKEGRVKSEVTFNARSKPLCPIFWQITLWNVDAGFCKNFRGLKQIS